MIHLKEKFEILNPLKNNWVGLYACGATVYDYAHIGNLITYIFTDIFRRTLEFNHYDDKHVMNITDVGHLVSDADAAEDKMLKGARKQNKSAFDITKYFEALTVLWAVIKSNLKDKDSKGTYIILKNILCIYAVIEA